MAKEAIVEAEPHQFLIRVMDGRKFRRAGDDGGRRTTDCYPTLPQSIDAAQLLLRKIAPDLRAQEITGADGGPLETIHTNIQEASQRVAEKMGMMQEGVARGIEFVNGRYLDHIQYALLRSDVMGPEK